MAELSDELLEDALNAISNAEASGVSKPILPEKNRDDRINELFDNLGGNFADDIMKNLADVNIEETNELIENVLGELMSKEILYEPFVCLKAKIEKEITNGNKTNEKALAKISEIIRLMDQGEKDDSKNKDRMMELIYELQEQGDLWASLSEE